MAKLMITLTVADETLEQLAATEGAVLDFDHFSLSAEQVVDALGYKARLGAAIDEAMTARDGQWKASVADQWNAWAEKSHASYQEWSEQLQAAYHAAAVQAITADRRRVADHYAAQMPAPARSHNADELAEVRARVERLEASPPPPATVHVQLIVPPDAIRVEAVQPETAETTSFVRDEAGQLQKAIKVTRQLAPAD